VCPVQWASIYQRPSLITQRDTDCQQYALKVSETLETFTSCLPTGSMTRGLSTLEDIAVVNLYVSIFPARLPHLRLLLTRVVLTATATTSSQWQYSAQKHLYVVRVYACCGLHVCRRFFSWFGGGGGGGRESSGVGSLLAAGFC